MTTTDISQNETDKIYGHILQSLQQGRQPGTYKQIGLATGVNPRRIGEIISNLSALGQLEASKPADAPKYSPLQYDIPGHEFPTAPTLEEDDPDIESRRLISEATKQIRAFHEQGYSPAEIVKLTPDHIDGSGWAESAIICIINRTQPSYAHVYKAW